MVELPINKTSPAWVGELDFLRCFAILAVLAIHVSAYFTKIDTMNMLVAGNVIIDEFSHFAVPLFILISGLVLSLKYWEKYDIRSFYTKRFFSVVPQYLVFSLFYILFFLIIGTTPLSLISVVYGVLTANAAYHLWFFAVIIEFYLVYPLIVGAYRYFEQRGRAGLFLALCLVVQLSWQGIRILAETMMRGGQYYSMFDNLSTRVFLSLVFYFALGIYIARNFDQVKATLSRINIGLILCLSVAIVFITSIVLIAGVYVYNGYSMVPPYFFIPGILLHPLLYALVFILLYRLAMYLMGFNNIISRLAADLGKYSFGIYLIHVFYLEAMVIVFGLFGLSYGDWLFYPLLFLSVLVLSYVSIYLISFVPWSQYIVGAHNHMKGLGRPEKSDTTKL